MAAQSQYAELARQLSAIGAVKRGLTRILPAECPSGSAAVLTLLERHGEMRMSRLAELLAVDMSVTSRHVAHAAERGWIERLPDPGDRRSRILRLTPAGLDMLGELAERTTDMFARNLKDWSDDDVGLLIEMLARLRDSFGDCRVRHPDERQQQHSTTTRTPA
ncbi:MULTISPECIES: MarR family transcriptional regulator [unclassified Streptomyces]|uniref:MarR family winged helix-turn-helix transcriptional regulator n=1 Tax=unclassified Streptomyces TaxID=2593676 RepID=UPI002DDBE3B5|nr:MarR family transcriptional regulator [Streptomyces sp. NBC_01750]WSB01841.1 MarR family transcriptional regulator [Streptomyces sp. NBC_01794]WSD33912.1 MarR family transcriptional regulator [Streptomyces sp. NBC_01750]